MHSPIIVANYFIARANQEGALDLNPGKLHTLVYLAHGWHIGQTGQALINVPVAAFRDAIIVPELKDKGCWGTRRQDELLTDHAKDYTGYMKTVTPELKADHPTVATLSWIWQTYGALSGFELSKLAREVHSPWDKVWNHPTRTREEAYDIPFELIKRWFGAEVQLHQVRADIGKGLADTKTLRGPDRESTQRHTKLPDLDDLRPV